MMLIFANNHHYQSCGIIRRRRGWIRALFLTLFSIFFTW